MSRAIKTIEDAAVEIKKLQDRIALLDTKNFDLHGKRVVNASRSVAKSDYVIREEIENLTGGDIVQNIVNQITSGGGGGGSLGLPFNDAIPQLVDDADANKKVHFRVHPTFSPLWTQTIDITANNPLGAQGVGFSTLPYLEKDQSWLARQTFNSDSDSKQAILVNRRPLHNPQFPTVQINHNFLNSGAALHIDFREQSGIVEGSQFIRIYKTIFGSEESPTLHFKTQNHPGFIPRILMESVPFGGFPGSIAQLLTQVNSSQLQLRSGTPTSNGLGLLLEAHPTAAVTGMYRVGGGYSQEKIIGPDELNLYPMISIDGTLRLRTRNFQPVTLHNRFEVTALDNGPQASTAQIIAYNNGTALNKFARVDAIKDISGGNLQASLLADNSIARVNVSRLGQFCELRMDGSTSTSGLYIFGQRIIGPLAPESIATYGFTAPTATVDSDARGKINAILRVLGVHHRLCTVF